jgi:raffinose/stachyose/melibiose transport system substrate-binding protein
MPVDRAARPSRRQFVQAGLGLSLLGGGALATSGCGASTTGSSGSTGKSLAFFSWDDHTIMQPVLDLYTKQTGSAVAFSNVPPVQEYISTLDAALKAGTAADVFALTAENRHVVADGYLKDLSDQPFISVMNSANREFMTFDGKVYGLSTASWAGGIMYNKTLLAKAGATSLPDSWAGFLRLCAKLKSLGIAPYYEAAAEGNFMSLWGLLGGYFADQGHFPDQDIFDGKTTFAQTWSEPLIAYCELYTRGLVHKSITKLDDDRMISAFGKGHVAMCGAGPWDVAPVQKAAPKLSFDAAAVPGINQGTSYWAGAASPGYAINAKAKNPEAALAFLQLLAGQEALKAFGISSGSITTTSNYTPTITTGLTQQAEGARSGRIYLPVVHWPRHAEDLAAELSAQLQKVIRGAGKPQHIPATLDQKLKQLDG